MYNKDLELAAFAAGYVIESEGFDGVWVYLKDDVANTDGEHQCFLWNPENDDADSFRLSVNLSIEPHYLIDRVHAVIVEYKGSISWEIVLATEARGEDLFATVRKVIFKAAVELGRRLQ